MDLLGDIGTADQLTSARSENAVLQQKVKELTQRVKVLTVENESLKAEVELYREEAAAANLSNLAISDDSSRMQVEDTTTTRDHHHHHYHHHETAFVRSGNGVYPKNNEITLSNLHGASNPLCCALSPNDTILATGGADSYLSLCQWGAALGNTASKDAVVQSACRLRCDAPVICTAFSPPSLSLLKGGVVAAGCMDGSLQLVQYSTTTTTTVAATRSGGSSDSSNIQAKLIPVAAEFKHRKYVRTVAWSSNHPILATSSADGTVHLYKVEQERSAIDLSVDKLNLNLMESLHLPGPVESLCFAGGGGDAQQQQQEHEQLICYARGTPYLSYFDLADGMKQRKINLNLNDGDRATGGFDHHVSFAVMDMKPFQNKYLAVATDTSRNMILDMASGKQIRNLYGHSNDGFSQPKLAWSCNGQYILGNTQDESCVCVWDIASSKIVDRLQGHSSPVRDLYSSAVSDTLVTTSFDKQTKLWFAPM